jgi:formamidopyrimidine-DNA glycosylase
MPELPEVETVVRALRPQLVFQVFVGVEVLWERTVDRPEVALFCTALTNAKVIGLSRRGKFIAMALDSGQTLLTHLRMTGKFLICAERESSARSQPPTIQSPPVDDRYIRVRFELADGRCLVFSDTRKFGRMYLVDDPLDVVGALGPEPLDASFTPQKLARMLGERRGRLKPLLLNQSFIAGLGNIYADEALWRARVHPLRAAGTLKQDEIAALHEGIVSVLAEAIQGGGTSLRDNQYRQPDGGGGAYQNLLAVYGREGQACLRCGTTIERTVIAQRGAHYCPECQTPPGDPPRPAGSGSIKADT